MNTHVKQLNTHEQLWSLVGPLLIAANLLIVSLRSAPTPIAIPMVGIIGLFVCNRWKWSGVWTSQAILVLAVAYQLLMVSSADMLWVLSLSGSIAAAFIVTGLTVEESSTSLEILYKEYEEQQEMISSFNKRLQSSSSEAEMAKEHLQSQIAKLQGELVAKQEKISSTEKLVALAREELTINHHHQEKLLKDLLEAKTQVSLLETRVQEQPDIIVQPDVVDQLHKLIAARDSEIEGLKTSLEALLNEEKNLLIKYEKNENELASMRKQQHAHELEATKLQDEYLKQQAVNSELTDHINTLTREKAHLEASLGKFQEEIRDLKSHAETSLDEYQNQIMQQKKVIDLLETEKSALTEQLLKQAEESPKTINDREVRRLEGLYNQLRDQFEEKSTMLDIARKELFQSQEKLMEVQLEMKELKLTSECEMDVQMKKILSDAEKEIASKKLLEKEIDQLQEVISALMSNRA